MGQVFEAFCPCGFASGSLFFGGGFANHEVYCGAPALCETCNTISAPNYFEGAPACDACGEPVRFYDEPDLQGELVGQGDLFEWHGKRTLRLPHARFRCPACGEASLEFVSTACWD